MLASQVLQTTDRWRGDWRTSYWHASDGSDRCADPRDLLPNDITCWSRYPVPEMFERSPGNVLRWLFDSHHGAPARLVPRWIYLRALAAIYFSAFYSLLFQIKGLIGPEGVLPADRYLAAVARALESTRFWYAPSLFWVSSSSQAVMVVTGIGLAASAVAFLNLWPRLSFFKHVLKLSI